MTYFGSNEVPNIPVSNETLIRKNYFIILKEVNWRFVSGRFHHKICHTFLEKHCEIACLCLLQFFMLRMGLNISLSSMICVYLICKFFQAVTVSGCASVCSRLNENPKYKPFWQTTSTTGVFLMIEDQYQCIFASSVCPAGFLGSFNRICELELFFSASRRRKGIWSSFKKETDIFALQNWPWKNMGSV